MLEKGTLVHTKGIGASGSFKIAIEQRKDQPIVQEYDVPVFLILLLYVKDGYRKSTNTVCTKAVTMLWQCYKD